MREKDLRSSFGVTLIATHRGDEVIISSPADMVLQVGDCLVLIGKVSDLDQLGQLE